jgi:endonuclease YncB( thermonuclease family)
MSVTLRRRALLLLVASLGILYSCSRETPRTVSGKVVKIADGDTITILDAQNVQHKIRLQGIDAPERRQDFGEVSREHLATLVFGRYVKIEYEKVDRYGRLVGKVWVDDHDECLEQLKAGLAWQYREYEKEQLPADRQLYENAEQEARTLKRGLRKDPSPTAPWEYRHHANGTTAEIDSSDEPTSSDPSIKNGLQSLNSNLTNAPNPNPAPTSKLDVDGGILGNKRTMIYHWPGCPNYEDIALHNRVPFHSREAAEKAGYRAARNCR